MFLYIYLYLTHFSPDIMHDYRKIMLKCYGKIVTFSRNDKSIFSFGHIKVYITSAGPMLFLQKKRVDRKIYYKKSKLIDNTKTLGMEKNNSLKLF